MTDIDFDELDKAVSSLMNKHNNPDKESANSSPQSEDSVQSEKPSFTGPSQSDSAVSSSREPKVEPNSSPVAKTERSASAASIVRRPTGRFMDVVHPSSDMRSNSQMQAPSTRPARESKPLEPIGGAGATGDLDQSPVHSQGRGPSLGESNQSELEGDFLQHEDFTVDSKLEPAEELVSSPAPMQSPFLSDIEVNKRPLGGSDSHEDIVQSSDLEEAKSDNLSMPDPIGEWQPESDSQLDQNSNTVDAWSTETKSSESVSEGPQEAKQPEIPELSAEVLALESDAATEVDHQEDSEPKVSKPSQVQPLAALGDIPRQYSQETADDPEPSAVFEAAAEGPQELRHPEKKKSGWSVVFWILLLVIIGAAGGVAAWYFLLK